MVVVVREGFVPTVVPGTGTGTGTGTRLPGIYYEN